MSTIPPWNKHVTKERGNDCRKAGTTNAQVVGIVGRPGEVATWHGCGGMVTGDGRHQSMGMNIHPYGGMHDHGKHMGVWA